MPSRLQVYFSANMQRQAISDAMTKGLYEKTRDSQESVLFRYVLRFLYLGMLLAPLE